MAKSEDDQIPTIGAYRGVPLHDQQPPERIKGIVEPEIDAVYDMTGIEALYEFAGDITRSPEARMFATAKVEALWDLAAEERRRRPDISRDRVKACVAGLDSVTWRCPMHYTSCCPYHPRPAGQAQRNVRFR
jgi:hypothetical protein